MEGGCLNRFVLSDALDGTDDLDPSAVHAGVDPIDFVEGVFAVLFEPEIAGAGIEGHAKAVGYAVGENFLNIPAHLPAHIPSGVEKGIIRRSGSIVVESQDYSREMGLVRFGAPELIIRGWSLHVVLQPAPAPSISKDSLSSSPNRRTPPSWLPRGGCCPSPWFAGSGAPSF